MNADEPDKPDTILAFDTLFTNNQIQIYKVLLPYFEPPLQKNMAIYIKYMEFQYTQAYFKHHPAAFPNKRKTSDAAQMYKEILPFCSPAEKSQLEKMIEMTSNMKRMQEMMETVNMMKELFPEGFSFGEGGEIPPDMMQMFQMFSQ